MEDIRRFIRNLCTTARRVFRAIKDIFRKKPKSWAEREIELACKHEREVNETLDGEWDYGCACYESALKAHKSMMRDRHSGFSMGLTKQILIRLIEGKPLTPIEDTDDIWDDVSDMSGRTGEKVTYQCKRMSALFKYVYADGTVKYNDIDSCYCIDIHNGRGYTCGLAQHIIDEMFPITMPYMPDKPIKVYGEDVLTDTKNGDYDTRAVFYAIKPDGEKIQINRFFKECEECDYGWIEITEEEYVERKSHLIAAFPLDNL